MKTSAYPLKYGDPSDYYQQQIITVTYEKYCRTFQRQQPPVGLIICFHHSWATADVLTFITQRINKVIKNKIIMRGIYLHISFLSEDMI